MFDKPTGIGGAVPNGEGAKKAAPRRIRYASSFAMKFVFFHRAVPSYTFPAASQ